MSTIGSPVKKIQDIELGKIKTNHVYRNCEFVLTDVGIIVKTSKGTIISNITGQNGFFSLSMWRWTKAAMKAFINLGMITKDDMDKHIEEATKRDLERNREYDVKEFNRLAAKLGISAHAE